MVRHLACLLAAVAWLAAPASAQLPDQTTLNGAYNVRYLGANTDPSDNAVSFSGTLTFDGKGGFTVNGQGFTAGAALKYQTTGKYTVVSSGMVVIDNPFDPVATNGTTLYGGVGANGMIVASSTDTVYCDLFVAIPAATAASAATLTGSYKVAHMEFLGGDTLAGTRNTFFNMTSTGAGTLGNVTINGTSTSLKNAATTQTSTGATYTVTANGSGTLVLPAPAGVTTANTLLSGNKILYISADGSVFIAGSATGYDMEIGIKVGGTALNGLYWNAFLENYLAGSQADGIYSGQGSANEIASASNLEIAHQRTNPDGFASYDVSFSDNFTFDANGVATYSDSMYGVGANGNIAIGAGLGTNFLITVYLKAPTMTAPTGATVFLNPQGVVNGANSVPITAQVAPGEIITLFGTGLGPSTAVTASAPFPTTLGSVQVLINNTPAPVYYVSATQISAVVPYSAPADGSFLTIQVVNAGAQSNAVKVYSGQSSPAMFTVPPGGPFPGAIVHLDGNIVTSANPAKVGESLSMYLTGLGAVSPAVEAGAAAPSNPLSNVVNTVHIYIDGIEAKVLFQGLAPGFGGLYQMNITIPAGITKGDHTVEILTTLDNDQTLDSDNAEAIISIGG